MQFQKKIFYVAMNKLSWGVVCDMLAFYLVVFWSYLLGSVQLWK